MQYEMSEAYRTVESEDVPGSAAYHHVVYDVSMTSKYPLKIEEDHNKRPLTCNASVTGMEPVELTILPVMLCKYDVCSCSQVFMSDTNQSTMLCTRVTLFCIFLCYVSCHIYEYDTNYRGMYENDTILPVMLCKYDIVVFFHTLFCHAIFMSMTPISLQCYV